MITFSGNDHEGTCTVTDSVWVKGTLLFQALAPSPMLSLTKTPQNFLLTYIGKVTTCLELTILLGSKSLSLEILTYKTKLKNSLQKSSIQ